MNFTSLIVLLVACAALASAQNVTWRVPMVEIFKNGTSSGTISGHIVNGFLATAGQYPWQAGLLLTKGTTGTFLCGGSLIHVQWVLSAAHCTQGTTTAQVRLGTLSYNSGGTLLTVAGASVYSHASYNPSNLNNDIGIIKLPSAVTLSATIKLIALAPSATSFPTLQVSGWGKTCTSCAVSPALRYTSVSAITNTQCAATYGTSVIISSTICTKGATTQSTCQGDSGGPLVLPGSPAKLVGVVSFVASAGCDLMYPAGYVRAASFCAWIKTYIPGFVC